MVAGAGPGTLAVRGSAGAARGGAGRTGAAAAEPHPLVILVTVERVRAALAAAGIEARPVGPVVARTARQAADAVGADVGAIVKSLVFVLDGEPFLVLTSGAHRVDTEALGRLLGGTVTRADAETVRRVTGFPVGGVPPVGHLTPLRAYADPSLLGHERVWASLGRPDTLFAAPPWQLLDAAGAELLPEDAFQADAG